jgi:hypothetical protein
LNLDISLEYLLESLIFRIELELLARNFARSKDGDSSSA